MWKIGQHHLIPYTTFPLGFMWMHLETTALFIRSSTHCYDTSRLTGLKSSFLRRRPMTNLLTKFCAIRPVLFMLWTDRWMTGQTTSNSLLDVSPPRQRQKWQTDQFCLHMAGCFGQSQPPEFMIGPLYCKALSKFSKL